jgi:RNA polymerase sigma factor (sigma-70 family)
VEAKAANASKRVSPKGVTPAELREAERGFTLMLRKKFSAVWIAENARDVLGQANMEYAEWLKDNPPARNPVGWLLTCAYRRAQNLLDSETRKPSEASLEAVFHLADEATPSPEQQALDRDRHRRLREMLSFLPEKECELLALVYFEEHSIREAGRKVGWQKSAADRHHDRAMERLRALVGDDRSLLSPATLGLAAWSAIKGEGQRPLAAAVDAALVPAREAFAIVTEIVTVRTQRLAELWRRLSPFTNPSSAAATSGGGRALGACGVALATVVCSVAASSVVPIAGNGAAPHPHKPAKPHTTTNSATRLVSLPAAAQSPEPSTPKPSEPHISKTTSARARPKAQQRARATSAPQATPQQVANEFGVESGSASEPTSAPAPETPSSSGGSSGLSSGGSSGSSVGSEFGM